MKDKPEENEDTSNINEDIHTDRVNDPHWLINELNEILEKGMFKNG